MSKQSEAKVAQGYRTEQQNCGNCQHRKCTVALPAWTEKYNQERPGSYTLERHGLETNQRCGIGGFAIRKTATCVKWARLEVAERRAA
jgi:hypothetical protein